MTMTTYDHSAVTVRDLRASLAYYRDGLGLPVIDERTGPDRTTVTLALPGTGATWTLEEYHGVERMSAATRPCDPGFAHLCLYTGDAQGLFDHLHGKGFGSRAPVATFGDGALAGVKAVYTLDPDGFAVELYQHAGPAGPPTATGFFHHGLTVRNMDSALAFWRDVFGADLRYRGVQPKETVAPVVGLEPEELDGAFVSLPGDHMSVEIFEYRGIEQHPTTARYEDPAASRLALRVPDPEGLCERLGGDRDRNGVPRVRTPDGYPVLLSQA
ncbi:VOC family protein [Streptomyces sp. NPDC051985]|uniref:VOC family protein n=1 Tax=Streptomyces sp. NPDC051985 TaxID=3155807 RepID=UPI0034388A3C